MIALRVAVLALCLSACASAGRSEWPALTRSAVEFERAWAAGLGDEYVRVGSYSADVDTWNMVSIIRLPDESWLARRTEMDRAGRRVTVAGTAACEGLADAIEELQAMTLPTMRALELNRPFVVVSHPPDIRLRVRTYFEEGETPVRPTIMELRASFASPVFWWHGRLLWNTADCWAPEEGA